MKNNEMVWAEMARRKLQYHADEPWDKIRLWGLFSRRPIRALLAKGLLKTDMDLSNPRVTPLWVYPSETAYHEHIEPLLSKSIDELSAMAGW